MKVWVYATVYLYFNLIGRVQKTEKVLISFRPRVYLILIFPSKTAVSGVTFMLHN